MYDPPNPQIVRTDIEEILKTELPWKSLSGKKIMVTGAAGMLAAYIVDTLLLLPEYFDCVSPLVTALVRNREKAEKRWRTGQARRPTWRYGRRQLMSPAGVLESRPRDPQGGPAMFHPLESLQESSLGPRGHALLAAAKTVCALIHAAKGDHMDKKPLQGFGLRILICTLLLPCTGGAVVADTLPQPAQAGYDQRVVARVDAERALEHIAHLSEVIGPRPAGMDAEWEGADYVASVLESYGYPVELQPFPVPDQFIGTVELASGEQWQMMAGQ